jgi:hypothetical protein
LLPPLAVGVAPQALTGAEAWLSWRHRTARCRPNTRRNQMVIFLLILIFLAVYQISRSAQIANAITISQLQPPRQEETNELYDDYLLSKRINDELKKSEILPKVKKHAFTQG